jgi:beta-carotene 15,15'-dioxygenase
MPLIIGFTFYFIIWHSSLSLQNIIYFIRKGSTIKKSMILLQIGLYSLLSFIGISIFGIMGFMFTTQEAFVGYIFAALAVLTVPHMQVIQSMYQKIRSQLN